jgi:hypothetical protein
VRESGFVLQRVPGNPGPVGKAVGARLFVDLGNGGRTAWVLTCPRIAGFYRYSDGDLMTLVELLRDEGQARPLAIIGVIGTAEIVPSSKCRGQYWDQAHEEAPAV